MSEQEFEARPSTDHNLSSVVVPLLKGVLYQESSPDMWNSLLGLQARVRDYVSVIGLELVLDEAEGYAFLRSHSGGESEAETKLPRLVARRPLSFPVSLLLALLRKKLAEFDALGGDTRLVLSSDEIAEVMRVFLPECSNEAKLMDQMDSHLNKIADLGFMRRLKSQSGQKEMFEVKRILKAFVDAQWLAEFDERLEEYRTLLHGDKKGSGQDE